MGNIVAKEDVTEEEMALMEIEVDEEFNPVSPS